MVRPPVPLGLAFRFTAEHIGVTMEQWWPSRSGDVGKRRPAFFASSLSRCGSVANASLTATRRALSPPRRALWRAALVFLLLAGVVLVALSR